MLGLFSSKKEIEEKIFQKAVNANKPTFFQGLLGTGDYNRYLTYVKNEQRKQLNLEKEEFNKNYNQQEEQLKLQIETRKRESDKKWGVPELKQQVTSSKDPNEKKQVQAQMKEAERQVAHEMKYLNSQLDQLKKQRKREEHEMKFRHKMAIEQALKDARQRLEQARS